MRQVRRRRFSGRLTAGPEMRRAPGGRRCRDCSRAQPPWPAPLALACAGPGADRPRLRRPDRRGDERRRALGDLPAAPSTRARFASPGWTPAASRPAAAATCWCCSTTPRSRQNLVCRLVSAEGQNGFRRRRLQVAEEQLRSAPGPAAELRLFGFPAGRRRQRQTRGVGRVRVNLSGGTVTAE